MKAITRVMKVLVKRRKKMRKKKMRRRKMRKRRKRKRTRTMMMHEQ
jgi:hypothetical protein